MRIAFAASCWIMSAALMLTASDFVDIIEATAAAIVPVLVWSES